MEAVNKESSVSPALVTEDGLACASPSQTAAKCVPQTPAPLAPRSQEKKVEHPEPPVSKAIASMPAETAVSPTSSVQAVHGWRPPTAPASTPLMPSTPPPLPAAVSAPAQEPRKLSYAEVCQRPPKDPSPPSPCSAAAGQPLRELRVNKSEEPGPSGVPGDKPERSHDREAGRECKDGRPPRERDPKGHYRCNGPRGAGPGLKFREQRRPPLARRHSPQGAYRHAGKEQNIPPVSPK